MAIINHDAYLEFLYTSRKSAMKRMQRSDSKDSVEYTKASDNLEYIQQCIRDKKNNFNFCDELKAL